MKHTVVLGWLPVVLRRFLNMNFGHFVQVRLGLHHQALALAFQLD
jgi:hypothetical protein